VGAIIKESLNFIREKIPAQYEKELLARIKFLLFAISIKVSESSMASGKKFV
jgi:hypothetical protein